MKRKNISISDEDLKKLEYLKKHFQRTHSWIYRTAISDMYNAVKLIIENNG